MVRTFNDNNGMPIPNKLYSYRKWGENIKSDLSNYQLRLTSTEYFNDPYDCHVPPVFEDLNLQFDKYLKLLFEKPDSFFNKFGEDKNLFIQNLRYKGKFTEEYIILLKVC